MCVCLFACTLDIEHTYAWLGVWYVLLVYNARMKDVALTISTNSIQKITDRSLLLDVQRQRPLNLLLLLPHWRKERSIRYETTRKRTRGGPVDKALSSRVMVNNTPASLTPTTATRSRRHEHVKFVHDNNPSRELTTLQAGKLSGPVDKPCPAGQWWKTPHCWLCTGTFPAETLRFFNLRVFIKE